MMISLKDAHRIEIAINQTVESLRRKAHSDLRLTLSAYDADIEQKVSEQRATVLESVVHAESLNSLRYEIRQLIHEKNDELGLSKLLNANAELVGQMRILETLVGDRYGEPDYLRPDTLSTLKKKLESIASGNLASTAVADEVLLTTVLDKSTIDKFKLDYSALKRLYQRNGDNIGSLNITTKISVEGLARNKSLLRLHGISVE